MTTPNLSTEDEYAAWIESTGSEYARLECHIQSSDFRMATQIGTHAFPKALKPTDVVVRNAVVGINASDINATKGRYFAKGTPLPYPLGFEGLGTIVARGTAVGLGLGTHVAHLGIGVFAEYSVLTESSVIPIPSLAPQMLALTICGLTASLALSHVGEMKDARGNSPYIDTIYSYLYIYPIFTIYLYIHPIFIFIYSPYIHIYIFTYSY